MGIRWQEITARRSSLIHGSLNLPFDQLLTHPDPIWFNGGCPSPECLPIDYLRDCAEKAWHIEPDTMYYGENSGDPRLRERIAERMRPRGVEVDPSRVLVTNGAQQGLDLICKLLLEPGDSVIVEAPTYFGALQLFDIYEASCQSVELDEGGIIPESLDEALRTADRPKFIYTVSTYQNPTGFTIAPERRSALLEIAERYNVPFVEDDPYGELWFGGQTTTPLRAQSEDVIYLGSFSKTIAPSLRMGWMIAPPELLQPLEDAKEAIDIGSNRMVQRLIVTATDEGWLDRHLDVARDNYERRYREFMSILKQEMPAEITYSSPGGGFFIWASLPEGVDSYELMFDVAQAGAIILPGVLFYADGRKSPSFRLGFTTLSMDRYREGISRMAHALNTAMSRV